MDWAAGESGSDLSCTGSQVPSGRKILRASSGPEGQGSGPDSFFVRGRDRALEKGQSGIRDQFCRLSTRGEQIPQVLQSPFLTCGDGRQGSLYQDSPFQGLTPHFQGRSWESGGEDCQPLTLGPCRGRTALGRTPALPWTSSATWGEGRSLSEPLIPHLITTGVGVRVESHVKLSQARQILLTELPRLRAPSTRSTSVWVLVAGSGCP